MSNEDSAWTRVKTFQGVPVAVRLDNETPGIYHAFADPKSSICSMIPAPDAILVLINPLLPVEIDLALQARLEHFPHLNKEGGEVIEGVVILKDIGMSWEMPFRAVSDPRTEISLVLTPEEREAQEQEWREGAERGYELARKLGAKVTVACSRTGEGVEEAVDDVVMRVIEKRKAETSQG